MSKPSPTQLQVLRALANGHTLYWTDTMFRGFSSAKINDPVDGRIWTDIRISTARSLVSSGWIRRCGGQRPTFEYTISRAGRLVIPPECVDCKSDDVRTFDPYRCGPCAVKAAGTD